MTAVASILTGLSSAKAMPRQYQPRLVFDYSGVAVVRPNEDGRVVTPHFTPIHDLTIDSILAIVPQGEGSPGVFTFKLCTDFDGLDMFLSFGEDGIRGLKLWIEKLRSNGLLCVEEGTLGYDIMDAYIEVASPKLRTPPKLNGLSVLGIG